MLDSDDLLARIDTTAIYQPFLERCNALVENCKKRGAIYVATSGTRTFEQQQRLYDQGRTAPGRIVTHAKPGSSAHQYKCAIDFARDKESSRGTKGLAPDYNPAQYAILAHEAGELCLEAGYHWQSFQDAPHIQLPLKRHGITMTRLRREYEQGGYAAVVRLLDSVTWFK